MRLSRVNTLLLIAIIAINAFVLALPFWPAVAYSWEARNTGRREELQAHLADISNETPQANKLVIPSILLDQPVHQGPDEKILRQGLWLRPNTSTPDKGGNTVIVGHRFTYTNPQGTFYSLDKMRVGDQIGLWWDGALYRYTVQKTEIVPADKTQIEAPAEQPTLTLYTCTPLWNPKDRLVVTAALEEPPEQSHD